LILLFINNSTSLQSLNLRSLRRRRVDLAPPSGSPSREDEHDHLTRAGGTAALDIEEEIKRALVVRLTGHT